MIERSNIRKIADYSAVCGVIATFAVMVSQITGQLKVSETVVSGLAVAVSAIAGFYSYYVARIANSVSRHRRVFISYSHDQKGKAEEIKNILTREGAYVWLGADDVQPGDKIYDTMNSAIENSNSVIALISGNYDLNIGREIRTAIAKHVPVIAVVPNVSAERAEFALGGKVVYMDNLSDTNAIANAALR